MSIRYSAALNLANSDSREFAVKHRVILVQSDNGTPVDIALGALPFEVEMVRRAQEFEFGPGTFLPCCTAEDLFIVKAFASRPRDWIDAESIVKCNHNLDKDYILKHLSTLAELKEEPELVDRVKIILKSV